MLHDRRPRRFSRTFQANEEAAAETAVPNKRKKPLKLWKKNFTPNGPVGWAVTIAGVGAVGFAAWYFWKKCRSYVQQRDAALAQLAQLTGRGGPGVPAQLVPMTTTNTAPLRTATALPMTTTSTALLPQFASQPPSMTTVSSSTRGFDSTSGEFDDFSDYTGVNAG